MTMQVPAAPAVDEPRIRPVYLVLGISDEGRADAEAMIVALRDHLCARPAVGNRIRLGIVEFGARAEVRLALCDALDPLMPVPGPPEVGEGNAVSGALDVLLGLLDTDAESLADDVTVERPLCWLVTDRPPTDGADERRRAFRALTDQAAYPYLVPCVTADVPVTDVAGLVHPSRGANPMTVYRASAPAGMVELGAVIAMAVVDSGLRDAGRTGIELPHPERLPAGVR